MERRRRTRMFAIVMMDDFFLCVCVPKLGEENLVTFLSCFFSLSCEMNYDRQVINERRKKNVRVMRILFFCYVYVLLFCRVSLV